MFRDAPACVVVPEAGRRHGARLASRLPVCGSKLFRAENSTQSAKEFLTTRP